MKALFHGILHIVADRVFDTHDAGEYEVFGHEPPVFDGRLSLFHHLVGKAQGAHGFLLILA